VDSGWRKGINTKYRHYYRDRRAICGCKTRELWHNDIKAPHCPRCERVLRREAQV